MNKNESKQVKLNINIKGDYKPLSLVYSSSEAVDEASRCLNCKNPSCVIGCPINNNIPLINKLVKEKEFSKAYEVIKEKSVLPDICSRVCPHEKQCEGSCVLTKVNKGIKIGKIEEFISRNYSSHNIINSPINNKKVAVIGSGPSGISAAIKLKENRYNVTIYEKEDYLGGVVKWGIPSFRLDKSIIDSYIDLIYKYGINVELNKELNKDIFIKDLLKEYDEIIIATGVYKNTILNIENEDCIGVYNAFDYLKDVSLNIKNNKERKINVFGDAIVIGGGNVAMDASRSLIRENNIDSVKIVYRRTINEMPACKEELNDALNENIEFMELLSPSRIEVENNKLKGMYFKEMELSTPDESGRRRPIEKDGSEVFIKCDTIITALGFNPNTFDELIEIDKWGYIKVNEFNQTNIDNVYAIGDIAYSNKTVVNAMKSAINAVNHIINKNK